MGIFNGKAENIEDNRKKVADLSDVESPQDALEKYPSVYAIRTGVLNPFYEESVDKNERLEKIETDLTQYIMPSIDRANNELSQLFEQKIDVSEANQKFANAIKGKESGDVVSIRDVSPVEHNVKVKVKRKNLAVYPYDGSYESHGVTWTDNGDGTVSAVGTSSGYSQFWLTTTCPFEDGKTYTWTTHSPIELVLLYIDATGVVKTAHGSIVWSDRNIFKRLYLQVAPNNTVDSTTHPIIVEGTTVDSYWEPYIADLTQVNVEKLGKNILAPVTFKTYSKNGLDFTLREDGGVVVNGTSTAVVVVSFPNPTLKPGVSYAISLKQSGTGSVGNGGLFVTYVNSEGTTVRLKGSAAGRDKVVWEKEYTLSSVGLQIDANKTFNNTVFYPQIEIGKAITDYEPYIKPIQFAPNSDGTLELSSSACSDKTLQIDNYGAAIEAEYNIDTKKYIDRKFAELQALVLEV